MLLIFDLCSGRQMFIINTHTVKHTHLLVVSITEIIEYYKNGYMSATVGTRLHLASG
mgnify:FL=1|jgi:hypothetical protein